MRIISVFIALFLCQIALSAQDLSQKSVGEYFKNNTSSKVKKRKKSSVEEIRILGLKNLPEVLVKNELMIRVGDAVNPYLIQQSLDNIKRMGLFREAESSVRKSKKGRIWIITVKENYQVGNIIFKGANPLVAEALKKKLESQPKQVFSVHQIRKDIQLINNYYEENEYLFAAVKSVDRPQKEGGDLVFNIDEGYISSIEIKGNDKTKDFVIYREMLLKPGMPVIQSLVKQDLMRLKNLDYFESVTPDIQDDESGNGKKLVFDIVEKQTGAFNIGGGHGARSGLFLYTDITIRNLFGSGQLVKLKSQFGERGSYYNFEYYNPWMWPGRKSLGFNFWHSSQKGFYDANLGSYFSSGAPVDLSAISRDSNLIETDQKRSGFQYTFGLPVTYEFGTTHSLRVEDVEIPATSYPYEDAAGNTQIQFLPESRYDIRSYIGSVYYDSRDFRLNPLKGEFHTLKAEKAFRFSSKSLDFFRLDLTYSRFFPTFKNQTIAFRAKAGKVWSNDQLVSNEMYFVGGPLSVRGYDDYPNSFARGREQLIYNLEYRIIFNDKFTTMFFVDAGWSNTIITKSKDSQVDDLIIKSKSFRDAKVGKGVGFLIFSPLGPLRLDFGWDENADMKMDFSFGQLF